MTQPTDVIEFHPTDPGVDSSKLLACIDACFDCMQSCTTCADACLAEPSRDHLLRCIRVNIDCADVCGTTGRLLSRLTEPDWTLLRAQIQACVAVVRACAEECERHADEHEHCRVCAQVCRTCEAACAAVLAAALVSPPEAQSGTDVDTVAEQSFPASDPPPSNGAITPGRRRS